MVGAPADNGSVALSQRCISFTAAAMRLGVHLRWLYRAHQIQRAVLVIIKGGRWGGGGGGLITGSIYTHQLPLIVSGAGAFCTLYNTNTITNIL